MTFQELAVSRRSVRKFLDRPLEQEKIESIIGTTLTAPSSKNTRSTRLAVVTDRTILRKMASMRPSGTAFLSGAPMVFLVMGDPELSDLWRINASISATVLQFAAEALDLGSCWVQVDGRFVTEDESQGAQTTQQLLHELMPATKRYNILCAVAVGYPAARHKPHDIEGEKDKVIYIP